MSASALGRAAASAMKDEEELIVRCIAIRAAYGGMAGDITMLREFAAVWSTRSATTATAQDHVRTACAACASRYASRLLQSYDVASIHSVLTCMPRFISFADTPIPCRRGLAQQQWIASASGAIYMGV